MLSFKSKIVITILLLLGFSSGFALEIPKADFNLVPLNSGQWPAQFQLTMKIPKDFHAYLDKGVENIYLPIVIDPKQKLANAGLTIKDLQKPVGQFDDEVKATVLREQGVFNLMLIAQSEQTLKANTFDLDVNYQLCNELSHVCFRPQTAQIKVNLPSSAEATSSKPSPSFMEQLLQVFTNNQDNTLIMFGLMFLAGVLSVATPCVYPMLPITSMFIVNRANGVAKHEKQHALMYLLGIIGTYMALGLIAGMTGGAFNTFMQSAWVNLGFAAFFAFFAISLLGFYELSFMQNEVHSLDQHSARIQGLTGTWLMGAVAGLVISPCVGPIVFALLLQVADNIADKADALAAVHQALDFWGRLMIASQGSVMMAGFGLGVGLPFFLVSVVKFKKLPRAGYWMNKIKYGFGILIIYFAYTYFHKGMSVLGVADNATLTLALGMVAIWVAVIHCNVLSLLPTDALPNHKMTHFCGVLAIVVGVWLIVAGLGKTPIMKVTEAECATTVSKNAIATGIEEEAGITWYRNFAAAQKVALHTNKPIFVDFYADWCANCLAFKEEAAKNPALNQALREAAVAVKLVDKEPEFEQFRENPEHRQLKIGLPYFAILSPDGKLIWSSTDFTASDQMISVLQQARKPEVLM